MVQQDKELISEAELYGEEDIDGEGDVSSYYTTRDGGDWGMLLAVFQDVMDAGDVHDDDGKMFLAPPASCSFTYH